jgi:hypothetical protein
VKANETVTPGFVGMVARAIGIGWSRERGPFDTEWHGALSTAPEIEFAGVRYRNQHRHGFNRNDPEQRTPLQVFDTDEGGWDRIWVAEDGSVYADSDSDVGRLMARYFAKR